MFGFGTQAKESIGIIYDIGSDSVGGALVLFRNGQKPKIIYMARLQLPITDYPRPEKFKSDSFEAIQRVSKKLSEEGMSHMKFTSYGRLRPRFAYCILAAPWHASQTRTITMSKEKPFSVSRSLLKELTDSEVEAFTNDPVVSEELAGSELVILERQVMEIRLNGYETAQPYGKETTSLRAELFISVMPERVRDDITAAIRSAFSVREVVFSSFPVASFQVMRNLEHTPGNFMLCDVNGEFTELSLVEDDVLVQTVTVPTGKRTLLRAMAEETGSFPDEILSLLEAAREQKTQLSPGLTQARKKAGHIWIKALRAAIAELAPSSVVPKTMYLTADPEIEKWCKDVLGFEPMVTNFSGAPLKATTIGASFAAAQCDFSEHVRQEDVFFAIGALYADMTHGG